MRKIILSIASVFFLTFAYSQVPGTLSYQGIAVDNTGAPVADGTHFVKFDFYSAATGGTPIYSSTGVGSGNQVTTYKGMFTFIIGSGSAGNAPIPSTLWDAQVWVEVTADLVVLTPRIQLTSNPYAFKAQSANVMDAAGLTGTLAPARIAADAIDNTKLATGIDAAKLTTGTLPAARIAAAAIDNTKLATGIDAAKITTGTLPAASIAAGSIDNTKLAAGIDAAKLTTGTLPAARIGAGSITSTEILDGTVLNADIAATAAIVDTKLATISTAGKVSTSAISGVAGSLSGTLVGTGISATNVTTGTLPASVLPSSVPTGTGAAGQVTIWSGASALSSTANLTWDNTNFRLGIGTVLPAHTLDVNSAFGTTVNIGSSAADDVWTYYATSGAFVGAMGFRSNGNLVLFNSTDNLVISPTGNVGIGPTTPTAKLDVAGTFKLADATQGADKVLTSDASGNASWQNGSRNTAFHVFSNLPVSCPNSGNALISFAVEEFDDGNDFASNAFTAPTAGVYHFEATVTMNAFANNTAYQFVRLFKNGSIYKDKMAPTHTNISANDISTTVKLAAGDVITIQVFQNSGAPVTTYTSGSQFTYFSGYRVY